MGAYEILLGTATAVADPGAPLNAGIVDLDNAPRNADGLVEYTFEVDILKPVDITRGNDVLVYEINNRGRNIVFGYFHEAGRGYAAENAGSAFLMNQGYTYVSSGWLHGAPGAGSPRPVLATLPLATDDGRTITGTSMEEWQDPDSAAFGRLTYPAVTLDETAATLTHRQLQDDPRQTVPAEQWHYVDDRRSPSRPPRERTRGPSTSSCTRPGIQSFTAWASAPCAISCRSRATVPPTIGASPTRSSWTARRCSSTWWPWVPRRAAGWPGTSSTRASTRIRRGGASSTA